MKMKMNPLKWFLVFLAAVILIIMLGSCNMSPTGASTTYRVIDGTGHYFDADTVISSPIPNCIIVQGTNYNCMVCGNYTVVSKKP